MEKSKSSPRKRKRGNNAVPLESLGRLTQPRALWGKQIRRTSPSSSPCRLLSLVRFYLSDSLRWLSSPFSIHASVDIHDTLTASTSLRDSPPQHPQSSLVSSGFALQPGPPPTIDPSPTQHDLTIGTIIPRWISSTSSRLHYLLANNLTSLGRSGRDPLRPQSPVTANPD
jgi:hypothetical protein